MMNGKKIFAVAVCAFLLAACGKSKPTEEMSELEKLRAENRILRAEKKRAEMEASFLKKLNEIERRRG